MNMFNVCIYAMFNGKSYSLQDTFIYVKAAGMLSASASYPDRNCIDHVSCFVGVEQWKHRIFNLYILKILKNQECTELYGTMYLCSHWNL